MAVRIYREMDFSRNPSQSAAYAKIEARKPNGTPLYRIHHARGAVRSGKTILHLDIARRRAYDIPGLRVLVLCQDWQQFKTAAYPDLQRLMPNWMLANGSWKYESGATVFVKSSDPNIVSSFTYGGIVGSDGDDESKWGSTSYGLIILIEAQRMKKEMFDFFTQRLSQTFPDGTCPPLQILMDSMVFPGWTKQMAIQSLPGVATTRFRTADNPFLPTDYVEGVCQNKPSMWIDRYINGDEGAIEGLVYWMFDEDIHVLSNHPTLSANARYTLGLDWGINKSATCVALFATETDGTRYILDEIYVNGITIEELDRLARDKGFPVDSVPCIADPAIATGESDGQSVATKLYRKGWNIVTEGINKKFEHRIPLCQSRLQTNPATGKSYTLWSPKCRNAIREMQERMYDKDKEKPVAGNDHFCDTWEYQETWWGSNAVPKQPVTQLSIDERELALIRKSNERALLNSQTAQYEKPKTAVTKRGFVPLVNGMRQQSKIKEVK